MIRESSPMLGTLAARLDPRLCAVLVIDMQNDFCALEGYVEKAIGRDASACRAVVAPIQSLVDDARCCNIPVVWIKAEYDVARIPQSMRVKQLERSDAVCCAAGSWGADFHGVKPIAGERVFAKNTYSAFIGTTLATLLQDAGVRTVIFAGVQTNVCVENSVRDAFCVGFHCVVAGDCVASHVAQLHEATLANVRFLYGDVLDRSELAALWLNSASSAQEKINK